MRNIGTLLLLCTAALALAQGRTADDIFKEARQKEVVDGDIPAAILLYERVVRDFPANRVLVAKSLLQLGECYERLNQPAKSREAFQRIADQYKDQTDPHARAAARLATLQLNITTPYTDDPYSFALSPDGRSLVYHAVVGGRGQLWLRQLDTDRATPIPGTETTASPFLTSGPAPFWSPDGRFIGFFADQKLKRIGLTGGPPQVLADAPNPCGGSWGSKGVIVFAPACVGPLYRLPADGGKVVEATSLGGDRNHKYPHFLADGLHFVFFVFSADRSKRRVAAGSLDTLETQTLLTGAEGAVALGNRLLFVNSVDNSLMMQDIDVSAMKLAGKPSRLDATAFWSAGRSALAASISGVVAFRSDIGMQRTFSWRNRKGEETAIVGVPNSQRPCCMRFSSDGQSFLFARGLGGGNEIWLMDISNGSSRLLINQGYAPVWSPDGKQFAFGTIQGDVYNLVTAGRTLYRSDENKWPTDWSAVGNYLLFEINSRSTSSDLWALPLNGGEPVVVTGTPARELHGRFSPDGGFVAYQSNETGKYEVFVQPFPGLSRDRRKISVDGGSSPQWHHDGRELYFLSPDNRVMAAPVIGLTKGSPVEMGVPTPLFGPLPDGTQYAASPDGQRFLINAPTGDLPPINVLRAGNSRIP